MHIRREIANRRLHPAIQRAAIRQMTPQAHPRRAHPPIARRQRQQVVHRQRGVLVVGGQFLGRFPGVAVVGIFGVVLKGFWAGELVVGGGGGADVALAGDLAREALDGAGYFVFVCLVCWFVGLLVAGGCRYIYIYIYQE